VLCHLPADGKGPQFFADYQQTAKNTSWRQLTSGVGWGQRRLFAVCQQTAKNTCLCCLPANGKVAK
jgi:hypothetical protein